MSTMALVVSGLFGLVVMTVGILTFVLKITGRVKPEDMGFHGDGENLYTYLGSFMVILGFMWMAIAFIKAVNY